MAYGYGRNPWTEEPDWEEEENRFWDAVDSAYEAATDGTMQVTHGHPAEERAMLTAQMEDITEAQYV